MEKWGAEFVSPSDGRRQEFQFAKAWDKSMPLAYQVRRSEFDEILFRRAAQLGAQVIEGCRVPRVDDLDGFTSDAARRVRVHAEHDDGRSETWTRGLRRRCLGPRHLSGQPAAGQAPQQETQQRGPVRAFHAAPAANAASAKAMSPFIGSITAGFGSSRWRMAPPASAPWCGRTT